MSTPDTRYVKKHKCQVSVGELYRWILAKLSDKDIKRALHKYRDLMPRQSDWNRKLTQATNVPELGFRYLYRCGQIDESNHRTMQKMLKYIDRQDVLPYFDTILYNSNMANCSIEELKQALTDKVEQFLMFSTALTEEEVHPGPEYVVTSPVDEENQRMTRSKTKRRATDMPNCSNLRRPKRLKRSSLYTSSSQSSGTSSATTVSEDPSNLKETPPSRRMNKNTIENLAAVCCGQVRSAIVAGALGGPVVHTLLSSSLISMLGALRMNLPNNIFQINMNALRMAAANVISNNIHQNNLIRLENNGGNNQMALSPARLLAAVPHLLALARNPHPLPIQLGQLGPHQIGNHNHPLQHQQFLIANRVNLMLNDRLQQIPMNDQNVYLQNQQNPNFPMGGGNPHMQAGNQNIEGNRPRLILLSGGVGITANQADSCLHYYCRIRLRISIDSGSSLARLRQLNFLRQEGVEAQFERFTRASQWLSSRNLGEFICSLRFNQLAQLEAFWRDYLSGDLKKFLMEMLSLTGGKNDEASNFISPLTKQENQQTDRPLPDWMEVDSKEDENMDCNSDSDESNPEERSKSVYDAITESLERIKTKIVSTRGAMNNQNGLTQSCLPSDCDINLFISKKEYENGRLLLMRNLRSIPSLCRLVAATNFLPNFK